jgi:hypothetical protein
VPERRMILHDRNVEIGVVVLITRIRHRLYANEKEKISMR